MVLIDLHTHERLFSACSLMGLEDAIWAAKDSGLDGICITNHDSLDIRNAEYLRTVDFPVFIGAEVRTVEGDIVPFGLDYLPSFKVEPTAQQFIDYVRENNGFCFAAHPFRRCGGGINDSVYAVNGLHAIEVFNGCNTDTENSKALAACLELELIQVAGSDAHEPHEVGRCVTWFPEIINSE